MEQERMPKPGQLYRHFKNKLYQIITTAIHSETGEELVIYQALYDDFRVYARPLAMFISEVDKVKYPGVLQKYRFELVEPKAVANDKLSNTKTNDFKTSDVKASDVKADDIKASDTKKSDIRISDDKGSSNKESNDTLDKERNSSFDTVINAKNIRTLQIEEAVKEENEEGKGINPILLEFLDTDSYKEKLSILLHRKKDIDDKILNDMAVSMDCTLDNGDLEERFQGFVFCLQTYARFEDRRLR